MSRRRLAEHLGHPDTSAGIPEARWMRAMTFERLVRDERFVSQLLTTAVGALGLDRPTGVRRADGHVDAGSTALALKTAHSRAVDHGEATIVTGLAVPFVGMEAESDATPVKPDFAIVAPRRADDGRSEVEGSWLIMGDAKDYERVRSRIDDQRMLKGFLQVALGAESAAEWTQIPDGMQVHRWGALAVPRNAFLQPEAIVECLDDHRLEVRARADERRALLAELGGKTIPEGKLAAAVGHLEAAFDPRSCVTCSLFNFCRSELRGSNDPTALLTEIGIRPEYRPALVDLVRSGEAPEGVPESVTAGVRATLNGLPVWTGQRRIDPVGEPGTVEVVLAKADAAALGVHGVSLRRIGRNGTPTPWKTEVFQDPQSPKTRSQVMTLLGQALDRAMVEQEGSSQDDPGPVHVVVPDAVTGDVLVSIADSLAGVETSRLRWQRDRDMGRPALTFDGEPAKIPSPLPDRARLAVSFLLEADRSRAMMLRDPIVDIRAVLAGHVVPGGPAVDAGRLDYLVEWAGATNPVDHRSLSDGIAASEHTPGARLSNVRSDAIHEASRGKHTRAGRGRPNPKRYQTLVRDELAYKQTIVERAARVLDQIQVSRLRPAYRALEQDAQKVWRRRLRLQASDLVRFGRTSEFWRNKHVEMLDSDTACAEKLQALASNEVAVDGALDAGTQALALATVTSTAPLRVEVDSRRLGGGSSIVALHIDGHPVVETDGVTLQILKGSFKFGGLSVGPLVTDDDTRRGHGLRWEPGITPTVHKGSTVVVADADWFTTFKKADQIAVDRPGIDDVSAPTENCNENSYADDPSAHRYCCRPHAKAEADTADWLAERRSRGELNPQTWPPVVDEDQFDISAKDAPTAADEADSAPDRPDPDLTIDDLD